jgi:hypothetical protein
MGAVAYGGLDCPGAVLGLGPLVEVSASFFRAWYRLNAYWYLVECIRATVRASSN